MQTLGYIYIDGQKVLILIRDGKHGRYLKVRKSGKDGQYMSDEQDGMNDEQRKALLNGEVIYC